MKDLKGLLLRSLLFLVIFSSIIYSQGDLFVKKKSGHKTWNSFYNQKPNSIDMLYFGNSHLGNGLDLNVVSVKTNAKVNTLYSTGQVLSQIYYSFKESLKYQTPKLILIETFSIPDDTIFYFKDPVRESEIPFKAKVQSLDSKRMGKVKIDEYFDLYQNEDFISTLFPFVRNHSNWSDTDLLTENLNHRLKTPNEFTFYHGSSNSVSILTSERVKKYKQKEFPEQDFSISENQLNYFDKIVDLAKENNVEIMLLTIPYLKEYRDQIGYDSFHNAIKNLANQYQLQYLDLNRVFDNWDHTYFSNEYVGHNQHLNYKGAIKASNYFAEFINSNYKFKFNFKNESFPEYYLYNNIVKDSLSDGSRLLGNLELINGKKRKQFALNQKKTNIKFEGWQAIENQNSKKNQMFIALKSQEGFIFVSKLKQLKHKKRKDVSKFFKKEDIYDDSGFVISINSNLLDKGKYEIYLVTRDKNGNVLMKNTKKDIEIN